MLRSPEGDEARRAVSITHDTLLRIARLDANSADSTNGRGVSTAHDTVAAALGMCKRTVQRGRELIQRLGFAIVVVQGRYLTRGERDEALLTHGNRQLRAASVRALTVPKHINTVKNVHLPRKGLNNPLTHLKTNSPKRAYARKAASRLEKSPSNNQPLPQQIQKLATQLSEKLLFLGMWRTHVSENAAQEVSITHRSRGLRSLERVISRSGIAKRNLQTEDVLYVLDTLTRENGQITLTGSYVQNPLGYLTTLLRRVVNYVDRTEYLTRETVRAGTETRRRQLHAAQEQARIERQAERELSLTPEALAARAAFFESRSAKR